MHLYGFASNELKVGADYSCKGAICRKHRLRISLKSQERLSQATGSPNFTTRPETYVAPVIVTSLLDHHLQPSFLSEPCQQGLFYSTLSRPWLMEGSFPTFRQHCLFATTRRPARPAIRLSSSLGQVSRSCASARRTLAPLKRPLLLALGVVDLHPRPKRAVARKVTRA